MICCTYCSKEDKMLFTHLVHEAGMFCIKCYMQLHGSCATCNESFVPKEHKVNVNLEVKFIKTRKKTYMFCDDCYEVIRKKFPKKFA